MIGLRGICGEDLHQPLGHALLVRRERIPRGNLFGTRSQFRIGRDDAQLELALVGLVTVFVPALVELALELVNPLLRHMVWSVGGAGSIVDEEWAVGRGRLL